jgi:oligopeptidase A
VLSLDQPTYVAVVTDAESENLRRAFHEAWTTRASDQGPTAGRWDNSAVMEQILQRRHEAARLLDFPNFAQYALATRMAHSVEEVLAFLHELTAAARGAAQAEFAELEAFAGRKLAAWDVGFYAERLQRERFQVSQEELRPYFPLPRVLAGLFEVAERLFAARIRERAGVPVWHPDVRFFEITTASGETVGSFYLDAYARPNKRSGAWMDECVGRKRLASGAALPVAYLVCNFLPPGPERPALLTHDDVVTLFHEFGHGLHHLLTRVDYPTIAGINGVAWDAVELPSQFLENYAWHPEVLQRISGHFASGMPLPADQQTRLIATRSFHAGLSMMRQLEFALFDFRIHTEYSPERGGRILEILREVRKAVAVVPVPEWNRFPNSFGHIFAGGYAAGYYSYKWAEVLAADAFAAFEEHGVFDRRTAQHFLDAILSRGGSRDALEAFMEFRGRRPDVRALLKQHGIDGSAGERAV